jgi:hypothetical protein
VPRRFGTEGCGAALRLDVPHADAAPPLHGAGRQSEAHIQLTGSDLASGTRDTGAEDSHRPGRG